MEASIPSECPSIMRASASSSSGSGAPRAIIWARRVWSPASSSLRLRSVKSATVARTAASPPQATAEAVTSTQRRVPSLRAAWHR